MTDLTENKSDDDSTSSRLEEKRERPPPPEEAKTSTTYKTAQEVDADVVDSAAGQTLRQFRRDPETTGSMPDAVEVDLADSAARLVRLMEAETEAEAAGSGSSENSAEASEATSPRLEERGLAGFQSWLTRTRQLGRRASQLLEAVDSINGPRERKQVLADIVRLNLLLECNSAIGFNADGTLRNTEVAAIVLKTEVDEEESAAGENPTAPKIAAKADPETPAMTNTTATAEELPDDAEVIMDKEELFGKPSGNVLLVFTSVLLVGSVWAFNFGPPDTQWFANWLLLVTGTCCGLMTSLSIFVRAGQRHRPLEAYREMGRELQNNRVLISTVRGSGG